MIPCFFQSLFLINSLAEGCSNLFGFIDEIIYESFDPEIRINPAFTIKNL
jgi:hypothetical protein